jgi:hypothetical protein
MADGPAVCLVLDLVLATSMKIELRRKVKDRHEIDWEHPSNELVVRFPHSLNNIRRTKVCCNEILNPLHLLQLGGEVAEEGRLVG